MTIEWDLRPLIGGSRRPSRASEQYDNINPATESPLCSGSIGHVDDVDAAVQVARSRFEDGCWSGLTTHERAHRLRALADLVARNKEELALLDTLEMGKPLRQSLQDAEILSPARLRASAEWAIQLIGTSLPLTDDTIALNYYEPRGVIGAIAPWNFPTFCAVVKLAPALAAGNTIVLKPSEISPSSALRLGELAIEAGIPEGVVNIVTGLGTTVGAALAAHHDVDLLSFTGSTITGRKIMELAGQSNGKPLLLECGGKSPQIIFGDVNLDVVAEAAVRDAFSNQGQVCTARTRLIVQNNVCEALLERLVFHARSLVPADPLDPATNFGPLASPLQRDRVQSFISRGLADGARPALLGAVQSSGGCFVAPTIFDDVTSGMGIVNEEIFGPILCVQRFTEVGEAIALGNASKYGLAATVWTRDTGIAKRMVRALRSNLISVRTSGPEGPGPSQLLSSEPRGASGFGAERGVEGLRSYSTLKAVTFAGS